MSLRSHYVDQHVHWLDPATPKQGHQMARVMDLAGHYVLVKNETGSQTGKKAWVHKSKLTFFSSTPAQDLEEVLRRSKVQANREDASRGLARDRNDPLGVSCLVCFGRLEQPHTRSQGEQHRGFKPLTTWLYCQKCDRMQRHQQKPVQSEPLQRRQKIPEEPSTLTSASSPPKS